MSLYAGTNYHPHDWEPQRWETDIDGTCGRKYNEFARIAADFKKLEQYSLPYLPRPEAAVAYCYENIPVYQYSSHYYRMPYKQQVTETLKVFHRRNLDFNMVDLRNMKKGYRILIIPGHAVMTGEMAENLKEFVREGGIAVMTAYSAKVNENNTVFDTPQPGLLTEVFGIRAGEFRRAAGCRPETKCRFTYWENIELKGAGAYASYTEGEEGISVSVNRYGKGWAYYTSPEADADFLGWLYDCLAEEHGLQKGIAAPEGVVVRELSEGQRLYVNTTPQTKEIRIRGMARCVLREAVAEGSLVLGPYDGELLLEENE